MNATFRTPEDEVTGSSSYALCDGIDAHPQVELARAVLVARGIIATTAKMKRYRSVLLGPLADVERHRETRSLELCTVDQLLAWAGYGVDDARRERWIDEAMASMARGQLAIRPIDALLDTGPIAQKERWIRAAPAVERFTSQRWAARALAGEDEPGAAMITHVTASRRAPIEWARALVAQRRRFSQRLTVELRAQEEDGLSREALELLAHGQLHGLSLYTHKDRSNYLPYADSMPEGLRDLAIGAATREDLQALAARSALRSVDSLSVYTGNPCASALTALLAALDRRRSLVASLHNNEFFVLQALAEGCDWRELERLELNCTEVSAEDLRALARACASGSLRTLKLGYLVMGDAVAEEFAASSALSGVESITIQPKYRSEDQTSIDRFCLRLRSAGVRRFEWRCGTRDEDRMQRALGAIATNPSFAPLSSLTLDSIGRSCEPVLRALLDQRPLTTLDLSPRFDGAWILSTIAESRAARTLRSLTIGYMQLSEGELSALCTSDALAGLERLAISPAQVTPTLVKQLAASPMARSLRELSIFSSNFAPGLARALCDSGLSTTLARLTIAYRYFAPDELWELKRVFGPVLNLL